MDFKPVDYNTLMGLPPTLENLNQKIDCLADMTIKIVRRVTYMYKFGCDLPAGRHQGATRPLGGLGRGRFIPGQQKPPTSGAPNYAQTYPVSSSPQPTSQNDPALLSQQIGQYLQQMQQMQQIQMQQQIQRPAQSAETMPTQGFKRRTFQQPEEATPQASSGDKKSANRKKSRWADSNSDSSCSSSEDEQTVKNVRRVFPSRRSASPVKPTPPSATMKS